MCSTLERCEYKHALRIARRARRVAETRSSVLVELAPGHRLRLARDEALIADEARNAGVLRHVRVVGEQHIAADGRADCLDLLDDRHERDVEEQVRVFGVVQDPRDLFREQARVHRVQHCADAHRAEPRLHVVARVPRQRRDPVARHNAILQQRRRNLLRALVEVAIGLADDRPLDRPGHDLAVSVVGKSMVHHLVDGQLPVLHPAHHGSARDRRGGNNLGRGRRRRTGRFRRRVRFCRFTLVFAESEHLTASRMRLCRALASDPRRRHVPGQFFRRSEPRERRL